MLSYPSGLLLEDPVGLSIDVEAYIGSPVHRVIKYTIVSIIRFSPLGIGSLRFLTESLAPNRTSFVSYSCFDLAFQVVRAKIAAWQLPDDGGDRTNLSVGPVDQEFSAML